MDDYESTRTPSQELYRDTSMHKKWSVLNPLAALPMRGQVKTVPSCSKKQQLRFRGLLLFNACIRSSIFIAQTGLSFGKKVFLECFVGIHGFMDSWIRGFVDTWIRGFGLKRLVQEIGICFKLLDPNSSLVITSSSLLLAKHFQWSRLAVIDAVKNAW